MIESKRVRTTTVKIVFRMKFRNKLNRGKEKLNVSPVSQCVGKWRWKIWLYKKKTLCVRIRLVSGNSDDRADGSQSTYLNMKSNGIAKHSKYSEWIKVLITLAQYTRMLWNQFDRKYWLFSIIHEKTFDH